MPISRTRHNQIVSGLKVNLAEHKEIENQLIRQVAILETFLNTIGVTSITIDPYLAENNLTAEMNFELLRNAFLHMGLRVDRIPEIPKAFEDGSPAPEIVDGQVMVDKIQQDLSDVDAEARVIEHNEIADVTPLNPPSKFD